MEADHGVNEIQTESNVMVSSVPGQPNTKIVTYGGTAKLVRLGAGLPMAVASGFSLPFHMTFIRTAQ